MNCSFNPRRMEKTNRVIFLWRGRGANTAFNAPCPVKNGPALTSDSRALARATPAPDSSNSLQADDEPVSPFAACVRYSTEDGPATKFQAGSHGMRTKIGRYLPGVTRHAQATPFPRTLSIMKRDSSPDQLLVCRGCS